MRYIVQRLRDWWSPPLPKNYRETYDVCTVCFGSGEGHPYTIRIWPLQFDATPPCRACGGYGYRPRA